MTMPKPKRAEAGGFDVVTGGAGAAGCLLADRRCADRPALLDASLRMHGIGGRRVIEAPTMSTSVSRNASALVPMIAERGAGRVRVSMRPHARVGRAA